MTDSNDSTQDVAGERDMPAELKQLGVLYAETGNPVFVWAALAIQHRERVLQRVRGKLPAPVVLPVWAEEYLLNSADELFHLAHGRHFKRDPRQPGLVFVRELNLSRARGKVAEALGLVSQGSTAFKDYQATFKDVQAQQRHQALLDSGMTAEQALGRLGDDAGKERSVVRKRITRGARLVLLLQDKGTVATKRRLLTPPTILQNYPLTCP